MLEFLKELKILISYSKKKNSRIGNDREIYNAARYKVYNLIFNKKK